VNALQINRYAGFLSHFKGFGGHTSAGTLILSNVSYKRARRFPFHFVHFKEPVGRNLLSGRYTVDLE
jgi:hypothetical protein